MLRTIHSRVHELVNSLPVPGILVSVLDDVCTVLSEFMGHYEDYYGKRIDLLSLIDVRFNSWAQFGVFTT